jgi:NhaP-type Na+/H+ or K+/H+ antiporter
MDFLRQMLNETGGDDHDSHEGHLLKLLGIIMFMGLLIMYITIGSYMEVNKFSFGHETGVIILLGAACSATVYGALVMGNGYTIDHANNTVKGSFEFPNELFFEVLLPLIIFATGYNMRRQKFFENITNIAKFGLLGTFLTFIFYSVFTWLLFENFTLYAYDINATGEKGSKEYFEFSLDLFQILFVCSIYCSSDIIAAVTIVKYEEQPMLFSLILGEGLFNDAVAIILCQTMKVFVIQ